MKRLFILLLCLSLILCSCGSSQEKQKTKKVINSALEYEIEWIDVSHIEMADIISASIWDNKVYFKQHIYSDDSGGENDECNVCTYDMVDGTWTELKPIAGKEKIDKLGRIYALAKSPDGNWYFQYLSKYDSEKQHYNKIGFARVSEEGEVEDLELPQEMQEKGLEVTEFSIRGDGKISMKVATNEEEEEVGPDKETRVALYDPVDKSCEFYEDMHFGMYDLLSIEDDFFCYSMTGRKCGYNIKNPSTGDVIQREIVCEGEPPQEEGGWKAEPLRYQITSSDEDNNVYMINAGGIYGGYYKDKEMKQIIPRSVILQLKLQTKEERIQRINNNSVTDLWRGADPDYADFYVLIGNYTEDFKIIPKLAHIKRKGA